MRVSSFAASLALVFVFSPAAMGTADAEGWEAQSWDRTITWRGSARDDINYLMYTLHTTGSTKPGVMFSCSEEYGLNILYSFENIDLMELFHQNRSSNMRSIPIDVWVGSYKFDLAFYNVRRRDKVFANQKAAQASIAMGALLQNLPIRAKSAGYFDVTYDLPPLDEEVMVFINVCKEAESIAEKIKAATSAK